MSAYYNEKDPAAAQWLRNLIAVGSLPDGDVDERSIEDVLPSDLKRYDQCHFFAGIGMWSYALRQAGWPDDRKIWTGSCPCQPFSTSGKRLGFADERHLWPAFHHLISQCGPDLVAGEQVASSDGLAWLDLVQADMEASGFTFGALNFPAAGVGAPEIRQRIFWMGHSALRRLRSCVGESGTGEQQEIESRRSGLSRWMASGHRQAHIGDEGRANPARLRHDVGGRGADEGLADADWERQHGWPETARSETRSGAGPADRRAAGEPGPVNGFWQTSDWLLCRDDNASWRPVEPGSFPLAHGMPRHMVNLSPELQRLARLAGLDRKSFARAKSYRHAALKGFGNAIVAPAAKAFITAMMEILVPMLACLISLTLLTTFGR